MSKELSKKRKELDHQESVIQDGLKSFQYVGEALRKIRDDQLYLDDHESFESYCKSRWQFSRPHAYRLIEAAEIVTTMSPIGDTTKAVLPSNESQARALAASADDTESRKKVWKAVVEESGGKPITAKAIKEKADEILPAKVQTSKPAKPSAKKPEPVATPEPEIEQSTFDPTQFDESMKPDEPEDKSPLHAKFVKAANALKANLESVKDGLGPLVRLADECQAAGLLKNHKSILGHYRQVHKEIVDEAWPTMLQLNKAIEFSGK